MSIELEETEKTDFDEIRDEIASIKVFNQHVFVVQTGKTGYIDVSMELSFEHN